MKIIVICIMCLFLASCATNSGNLSRTASLSGKVSFANAERAKWKAKAEANDRNAQYHMGNSYCCGKSGFFDTRQAIEWWCKASRQGHKKARKALAVHDSQKICLATK